MKNCSYCLSEDLRHGIVLGSKNYVSKIRSAYLPDSLNSEMPQQKTMAKEIDTEKLLNRAAKHLDCDLKRFKVINILDKSFK